MSAGISRKERIRMSAGISKKERIRNEEMEEKMVIQDTIHRNTKKIERRQLTWYTHIQRMIDDRLPKVAMKWKPQQRKDRRKIGRKE